MRLVSRLIFLAIALNYKGTFFSIIVIVELALVLVLFDELGEVETSIDVVLELSDFFDVQSIKIEGVLFIFEVLKYDVTDLLETLRWQFFDSLAKLPFLLDSYRCI